ncbi:MAG: threonine--tRNA ligase, partial [Candidatus Jacksonbacteria bacterium]|nr:threonine--tRNA ligase [Candidatus Jacksonbacteria bacterium]
MPDDKTHLNNLRHSAAHLLAAAVTEFYHGSKPAIGPPIESGFYYDFEFPDPISENDLPKIEKKMRELLPIWDGFARRVVSAEEAKKLFMSNPYKLELIDELSTSGETITV